MLVVGLLSSCLLVATTYIQGWAVCGHDRRCGQVNSYASNPEVGGTVYRTFEDGTSITRDTLFVMEGGSWKHRFTQEELDIFMPGTPYEEFVAAQQ